MASPSPLRTDEEEVLLANRAFYQALRELDLSQMESLWLHEDWVKCLHPGWELLMGWDELRHSWQEIFRNTQQMLVSISRALVKVSGDTGWVSCLENVTSAYEGGFTSALVEATNIFVRRHGKWLMVHHHTTPLTASPDAGVAGSVQ